MPQASQSKSDWRDVLDSQLSSAVFSEFERKRILSLFSQCGDVVDGRVGFTPLIQHRMGMVAATPVRSAPRRIPPFLQDKVKAELDGMVDAGIWRKISTVAGVQRFVL